MTELVEEPRITILTGASGWFGRSFLDAMTRDDRSGLGPVARSGIVRGLVSTPSEVDAVLEVAPQIEVHVGDVADVDVVERLFQGADEASVVHAAGVIHPPDVATFDHVNRIGTERVVAAARKAGARRLVYVSSNSPYGVNVRPDDVFRNDEPFNPYMEYGRTKMLAEQHVRDAHEDGAFETVVVRPPWFYGPWQPARQTTFFTMVRTGKFPILGGGDQRRSMAYVDNLVQGVALAERVPAAAGDAFWVADARPYPINEIVETVKSVLADAGYTVSKRQTKLPAAVGRIAEGVDGILQARGRYNQQIHVLGEMDKTIACDIAHTRDVLGYEPAVELAEGMRRSVQWCQARGIDL